MKSFIYQPKSGDRVFTLRSSPWMATILWDNGCRHVVGNFVELSWEASSPGRHWREHARKALKEMISQTGGIAWDEQGVIHACFPLQYARAVLDIMGHLSPYDTHDRERNLAALWKAGWGSICLKEGRRFIIDPTPWEDPARVLGVVAKKWGVESSVVEIYMEDKDDPEVIKAPWGIKDIDAMVKVVGFNPFHKSVAIVE